MPLPVVYLHGFASSPQSAKAAYLSGRLRDAGVALRCPDLNQPAFETLTMTRMLEQVARELDACAPESAVLVGSSLGGALAVLAAARFPTRVARLVLLAPAVMFAKRGHRLLSAERTDQWRRDGVLSFYHYGDRTDRLLRVAFYEDSQRYDAFGTSFAQPTLVFQGVHDQSVDCRTVEQFAATRPNVTLTLLDDDHQLMASLPRIWAEMAPFLGLASRGAA